MATPPPLSNPLNEINWINLLSLRRYDNSLVSPQGYRNIPLRDKFYHAAGLLCPTELNCRACDGEGVNPACEYCEEGYQECGECDGNGRNHCEQCDGEGQVWIDCDDCDEGQVTCENEKCNDGVTTCETCSEGKKKCEDCGGDGKDDDGKDCNVCDGEGEIDCDECAGEVEFECNVCGGSGEIDCEECEGNGQTEEECDTCEGEGETYCDYCEEGYSECNECDGEYEVSDCDDCEGDGVFVVEHERAGQYFLNPTKDNRKMRTRLMKEVIESVWPKIHKAGYNIEYKSSKKITKKYINNKIHNKVVIYILPYGKITRMIVIFQPRQFTRDRELREGIQGTAYTIQDAAVWTQYRYSSRDIERSVGAAIDLTPYNNEAIIITANIDIWKPYSLNYLMGPNDKI